MLIIHIVFVLSSFISFITRVLLLQFKPQVLNEKFFKVAPHIIDSFLLASGIGLVVRGDWIDSGEYGWIVSKFIVLLAYIVLGAVVMRSTGVKHWLAFVAAVGCYGYILSVAVSKEGFF
jgi:uncharacterized membrane protein SirB2